MAEQEKDSFGEAEESYENWIEKFIKYGTLSEVTREIVTELIEKIVVNGDKSIDIVFKYQSPYSKREKCSVKTANFFYNNFPLVIMNT